MSKENASTLEVNEIEVKTLTMRELAANSDSLKNLAKLLKVSTSIAPTGIVNFVVGHEDPILVRAVLEQAFNNDEIMDRTFGYDAFELQHGNPGGKKASSFIESKIFGSVKMKKGPNDVLIPEIEPTTGARIRNKDGLVNRPEVQAIENPTKERTLVISNIDTSLDFCPMDSHGAIDLRNGQMFVTFTNKNVRHTTRLLLVTSEPLSFKKVNSTIPFPCTRIDFPKLSEFEAKNVLHDYISFYVYRNTTKYIFNMSKRQEEQAIRKLVGLTYMQAREAVVFSLCCSRKENTEIDHKNGTILDANLFLKELRKRINGLYLREAKGITTLESRPWEDYVLPDTSNFSYHVKNMLRDFQEIALLRGDLKKLQEANNPQAEVLENQIEALENNIPHTMLLYGKGGVGKSAFPVHYAGLLGYDVIDFNINAMHSKWIGEGGENIRKALESISKATHMVIRIDEYDRAMGATNSSGTGMHEAHKQVEMEIMNWLANASENNLFRKNKIILVMTTNHKENLTGPLIRSGRMDLAIDISSFDPKAMNITLKTSARRMYNRGAVALGFNTKEDFQSEIEKLDIDKLSHLLTMKRFTVRDVESLLQVMARHRYYNLKYKDEGLPWNNEVFEKVIEYSEGSVKDDTTGELIIGDARYIEELSQNRKTVEQPELRLGDLVYDETKFANPNIFTGPDKKKKT